MVCGLGAVTASAWFAVTPVAAKAPSAVARAQTLLHSAETAAGSIAGQHGGSYARVGPINLRKAGLITDQPSATRPWVSSASGTADSYTVTVTAEPGGRTVTVTRNDHGTVTRS